MEVLSLKRSDCALLAARFREHGNSQRRMLGALEEAGAKESYTRLVVLRNIEKQMGVDLGMVCHRFEGRNNVGTHSLERAVLNYIAQWRPDVSGAQELWVRLDRIREVHDLIEGGSMVTDRSEA
jgi:hypothetical protein